ncbi:MAG: glycosyltransferase family 2 protein [Panacagrimonas sp.]
MTPPPRPPLVSVLVPCFNGAPMLEQCLRSVAGQTHRPIELIFVDNNSKDASCQIARDFARHADFPVQILSCVEQGQMHALNLAYRHAQGQYVQWLDSDDALHPGKLATQVAMLERAGNIDIAYGSWHWKFWRDGVPFHSVHFADGPREDGLLALLADDWRPPHSYLIRRPAAERLYRSGAWDPEVTQAQDRYFFTCGALAGLVFSWVADADAYYNNWSAGQSTRTRTAQDEARELKRLFGKLQRKAERPGLKLNPGHRWLLAQSRDLFRPNPDVATDALEGGFAIVASLVRRQTRARSLEHWSRFIVRSLWHAAGVHGSGAPLPLPTRLALTRQLLDLDPGPFLRDGRELEALRHDGLPVPAPVLVPETIQVRRMLDGLVNLGLLVAVE